MDGRYRPKMTSKCDIPKKPLNKSDEVLFAERVTRYFPCGSIARSFFNGLCVLSVLWCWFGVCRSVWCQYAQIPLVHSPYARRRHKNLR